MTWNLNNTTDAQPKNFKKEYKKEEYLTQPGAYKVTINGQTDQNDREGYRGSPYI